MADVTQRVNTYIKTLRDAQEVAQPTQKLDSASIMMLDMPNVRSNAAAKKQDVNTDYYLVIP